jgi:hypothetical protein
MTARNMNPIVGKPHRRAQADPAPNAPENLGKSAAPGRPINKNSQRAAVSRLAGRPRRGESAHAPGALVGSISRLRARSASAAARSRRTRARSLSPRKPPTSAITAKATTKATQIWSAKAFPAK